MGDRPGQLGQVTAISGAELAGRGTEEQQEPGQGQNTGWGQWATATWSTPAPQVSGVTGARRPAHRVVAPELVPVQDGLPGILRKQPLAFLLPAPKGDASAAPSAPCGLAVLRQAGPSPPFAAVPTFAASCAPLSSPSRLRVACERFSALFPTRSSGRATPAAGPASTSPPPGSPPRSLHPKSSVSSPTGPRNRDVDGS